MESEGRCSPPAVTDMKRIFSILLPLAILLMGCDDPSSGTTTERGDFFWSERSPHYLEGTVVNSRNVPVPFADIHFTFTFAPLSLQRSSAPASPTPSTKISFSIPVAGQTSLKIFRLGTRELIVVLIDTVLPAGNYSRAFDSGSITNGFYVYQLISGGKRYEKLMVLLNLDHNLLVKTKPVAVSDAKGTFRIPYSVFALDEEFSITTEESPIVVSQWRVDSIGIIINQSETPLSVHWLRIDKSTSMKHTFILK